MLAKDLKEWADTLPPASVVQFELNALARAYGWSNYNVRTHEEQWVPLDATTLRVVIEHPKRVAQSVSDTLLQKKADA